MGTLEEVELGEKSVDGHHSMPVHAETEGETSKGYSNRKRQLLYLIVSTILLLALTVGLAVGLPKKSSNTSKASATASQNDSSGIGSTDQHVTSSNGGSENAYNLQDPEEIEGSTNEEPRPQFISVVEYLVNKGVTNRTELEDAGSYANRAANWIANDDPLALSIPGSMGSNVTDVTFETRYNLAELFYATGGEKWTKSLNFLSEKPSCEWYEVIDSLPVGVGCNSDGQIAALFLNNNMLQNKLPSVIGRFTNLIMMDLDVNFISGPFPDSFQQLTNLEHMHIGSNGITGTLPSWIGSFSKLGTLNLGYNTMHGSIPSEISSLPALRELALDHNVFEGDINVLFGSSIEGLSFLEELFLDSNTFIGELDADFPAGTPNLKQLDLSDNAFRGSLPSKLFNSSTLEVLDIHDNSFSLLPENFPANTALKFFAAQKNGLDGTIPESMINLANLEHLDLSQNSFTGEISEHLGENLVHLTYLFLAENQFDPGPIPLSMSNLASLQELSLKSTQRTGTIPDTLGLLTELVFLDLDNNSLTGKIASVLGSLSNLKLLLLNRNSLTGEVPVEFGNLTQLEVVFLDGNSITGGLDTICKADMDVGAKQIEIVGQCSLCDTVADCCTHCCNEGVACNTKTHVADIDPIWQLSYQRIEYSLDSENWFD